MNTRTEAAIEVMAQALCNYEANSPDCYDAIEPRYKDTWQRKARVVLKAAREAGMVFKVRDCGVMTNAKDWQTHYLCAYEEIDL